MKRGRQQPKLRTNCPLTCDVGVRRCAYVTVKIPSLPGRIWRALSCSVIIYHLRIWNRFILIFREGPHGFTYFRIGKETHFCTCLSLSPLVYDPGIYLTWPSLCTLAHFHAWMRVECTGRSVSCPVLSLQDRARREASSNLVSGGFHITLSEEEACPRPTEWDQCWCIH